MTAALAAADFAMTRTGMSLTVQIMRGGLISRHLAKSEFHLPLQAADGALCFCWRHSLD
jgi:hypothetical protein